MLADDGWAWFRLSQHGLALSVAGCVWLGGDMAGTRSPSGNRQRHGRPFISTPRRQRCSTCRVRPALSDPPCHGQRLGSQVTGLSPIGGRCWSCASLQHIGGLECGPPPSARDIRSSCDLRLAPISALQLQPVVLAASSWLKVGELDGGGRAVQCPTKGDTWYRRRAVRRGNCVSGRHGGLDLHGVDPGVTWSSNDAHGSRFLRWVHGHDSVFALDDCRILKVGGMIKRPRNCQKGHRASSHSAIDRFRQVPVATHLGLQRKHGVATDPMSLHAEYSDQVVQVMATSLRD